MNHVHSWFPALAGFCSVTLQAPQLAAQYPTALFRSGTSGTSLTVLSPQRPLAFGVLCVAFTSGYDIFYRGFDTGLGTLGSFLTYSEVAVEPTGMATEIVCIATDADCSSCGRRCSTCFTARCPALTFEPLSP